MAKLPNYKIADMSASVKKYAYRSPIHSGGREIPDLSLQRVCVAIEERGKRRRGYGIGEMTLGTSWAWPSKSLSAEQTVRIVSGLCNELVKSIGTVTFGSHPIRFGMNLIEHAKTVAETLGEKMKLAEPIPDLAILLACSPIDLAVHDAFGRYHHRSTFECLGPEFIETDLSDFFGADYAGANVTDVIRAKAHTTLPVYHLIAPSDPLTARDQNTRVDDGRPETLEQWIEAEQLTHLKIRLCGSDLDRDVGRVIEIDRIATRLAPSRIWSYALDFEEACPNEDYVIDFIERVDRLSRTVLERLQYIEQPTLRQMKSRKDITMHRVGRLMSVVVDESLVGIDSLKLAYQLGYTGVALRTCKTLSQTLLLAAAAKSMKMSIFMQDMTCVGSSLLASASLAAHLDGISAIEGNGRQYCPAANEDWEAIYQPMYRIIGGVMPTELLTGPGLGFRWPESELADYGKGLQALAKAK